MLAVPVLLLLLSGTEPSYPLGPLRFPDLTRPEGRLALTDFRYSVSEATTTSQEMSFRIRLGGFAYLGGEVQGERRGVSFTTQRLGAAYAEQNGRHELAGSWRASRLLVSSGATRRPRDVGAGWVIESDLALRLGPDLELLGSYLHDTDARSTAALPGRFTRRGSLGFRYQRGSLLELSAAVARGRIRTLGLIDLDRDSLGASLRLAPRHVELNVNAGYEITTGRLPRRQGLVEGDAAVEIGSRLVLDGGMRARFERGAGVFDGELRAGITLFGRRHAFERSGEAAARTVELARRACALGYNEAREHGLDGRRALRERLALSARHDELAADIEALYRAQVAERNVPQAGVIVARSSNDVNGVTAWSYRAFLGVPWPLRWPWQADEGSVEFLRLEYAAFAQRFESGLRAIDRSVTLAAALNREQSLRFRWSKPGFVPADLIRLSGQPRRLELEYVYAYGR